MISELAVIFDMDGVLIDSVGLNWQAYNQVLDRQHHLRVSDEDISRYVGMTLADQILLLNKDFDITIDPFAFEKESAAIKRRLFGTLKPKEGVVCLLEDLSKTDTPVAVGTSSPRDVTRERLTKAGLWHYFNTYVTEENVRRHKPHPDVYIEAAKELNTRPESCVVFEDAPSGIEAAQRAGMYCIAIATPYVAREALRDADMIVQSLQDCTADGLRRLVSKRTKTRFSDI